MRDVRREGIDAVLHHRFASFIPLQLGFAGREASLLEACEVALADLRLGAGAFRWPGAPNGP